MKTTQLPFTVVLLAILLGAAAPALRGADPTGVAPDVLTAKKKLIGSIGVAKLASGRQPNVLFILADDLGYADLGSYGSKDIPTPNIDSLAKTGVRRTDGYVTAGTCSPSCAGMLSGAISRGTVSSSTATRRQHGTTPARSASIPRP